MKTTMNKLTFYLPASGELEMGRRLHKKAPDSSLTTGG